MSDDMKCRAAVAFERGAPLRIEEISVREPGPGEVRVRIAACGICASDLHVWRTGEGIEFPAVLGHEASGVVEAVGPGTSEVALGQPVVLAWIPRCGACRACRSGRTHLCTALQTNAADGSLSLAGKPLGRYMSVSGLSEYVVVKQRAAIPICEGLSMRAACSVGCGVTTGFGAAVITGEARWGESVAVFGCGGVGLSAVQGARIAGASRIIAIDPNRARLELATRLGATDCVSPEDGDAVAAIHTLTDGGVDLAIESVGQAAVVRQAFDALASGGRAIAVGLTKYDAEVSIPIMSLIFDKSLRGSIHGSADPARDFPKIFGLAVQGELQLDPMSGPDYRLEEVNDAFEASADGSAIRPRIIFEST
ncbi:MAG: alcohol dehydrogenase catalytic domain-containing protein [Deltaproteobacteria bacterium]|nr:alcohol dehydrogenase catalytic domain-containing protein [Deltaproteobacteria bacterium]MBW2667262.1 alcohol dehydrogenase catalytic domain-containing protein [Deltaproteobacteria bacterium]